jgi:hypothetical protein
MGTQTMKNLIYLSLFLVMLVSGVFGIKTDQIEAVRLRTDGSTAELTASDVSVINSFWQNALNTMQLTEDSQEIVLIRRQVEGQNSAQPLSSYATAFIDAAGKYLLQAFTQISAVDDLARRQLLEQNLMILTAKMETPKLASVALERIVQDDPIVRYWAVKAVTNSAVIGVLSDEVMADEQTRSAIIAALQKCAAVETQPEIQEMIIRFGATMNQAGAREILLMIADKRIEAYKSWAVENEILDAKLLIAIGGVAIMQSDGAVKSEFAQKFAELYSLIFQRYMQGQDALTDEQVEMTVLVMAEVDRMILGKMLNMSQAQTGIVNALKSKRGLDRVYETIFGDRLRKGSLSTTFNFDYGKDASGKAITEPPKLSEDSFQAGCFAFSPDGRFVVFPVRL